MVLTKLGESRGATAALAVAPVPPQNLSSPYALSILLQPTASQIASLSLRERREATVNVDMPAPVAIAALTGEVAELLLRAPRGRTGHAVVKRADSLKRRGALWFCWTSERRKVVVV